jgi:hypothetical protein
VQIVYLVEAIRLLVLINNFGSIEELRPRYNVRLEAFERIVVQYEVPKASAVQIVVTQITTHLPAPSRLNRGQKALFVW